MAASVSVNVSTNGLGTYQVFYGSGSPYTNYAEVHFFPTSGVTIDYNYHYKYTVTYKPEYERDPVTYEGETRFNGFSWMVQDNTCPLGINCVAGASSAFATVSWEITITGSTYVFPHSVDPEGSGRFIWFYRR